MVPIPLLGISKFHRAVTGRLLAVKTNRLLLQVFWGQEHLEFKPEPERTTAPPHKTPRHWLRGRAGRPRRRRPMSQCASPTHGGAATGGGGRGRAEKRALSPFFFDHPAPRTARGKGCTGKAGWGFISGFLSGATKLLANAIRAGRLATGRSGVSPEWLEVRGTTSQTMILI